MVTVVLTHQVKNFEEWKKHFESDSEARETAGLNMHSIYRGHENANMVTIIGEAPNAESVLIFVSNPALKATMEKAGVISAPELRILSKVD